MTVTTRLVDSGEATLFTEARGEAARGTILLAMGATASMLWWPEPLLDALAEGGYRVIRFDHRDTGQSTTNALGDVRYDLADLVGDLLAILDAYGVEHAHLVGMSLGGYVSQMAALQNPERIRSLTLIAAEPVGIQYQGEGIGPEFMAHFGTMGELDWSDAAAVTAFELKIAELSAGPAVPFERDAVLARIAAEISRSPSIASAFNHSMIAGELDPALTAADITQPILAIHGSVDPIIAVAAAEAMPTAERLILEGRGHELTVHDAPQIAAAILAHVAKADQPAE